MTYILSLLFLCIPLILTILILTLIMSLKKKRKTVDQAGMPNLFGKEMRNLLLIMIVFDVSFIIRALVDSGELIYTLLFKATVGDFQICTDSSDRKYFCNPYPLVVFDLIIQYVWDFIPLMCILLFHKANFKPV